VSTNKRKAKLFKVLKSSALRLHVLTPSQKQALARNACNLSSFVGLAGSLRASRVHADELKYSNHLIFEAGDVFAVTINCNFSKLSSDVIELRE
jgi:hypothetical protein